MYSGRDREMPAGRIFTWVVVVVNKGSSEAEEKRGISLGTRREKGGY